MKNNYKISYVIESYACKYFGIDPLVLKFGGKEKPWVYIRFVVWRALYELSGLSYPDIGQLYRKDHSTVVYGVKWAKENPDMFDCFIGSYRSHNSVKSVNNLLIVGGTTQGIACS